MASRARQRGKQAHSPTVAERVLDTGDASLLDVVDSALNKGVVLSGDVTLALAQVDLVYARLSVLLCAADRVLPNEDIEFIERHRSRRAARRRAPPSATQGRRG
jgi:Gas vesicle protein